MVWHWNCASALCQNNWRTKGIRYYTLPSNEELQQKYASVLKNKKVNWKKHVICSEHWEGGSRKNMEDIPSIACPQSQLEKFMAKSSKGENNKDLKKKISCAKREQKLNIKSGHKRKAPTDRTLVPIKKRSRRQTRTQLTNELSALKEKFEHLSAENATLFSSINQLQREMTELQMEMTEQRHKFQREKCAFEQKLQQMKYEQKKRKFSYSCVARDDNEFFYMCGLSVNEFNCLYSCMEPFLYLLIYPDCIQSSEIDFNNRYPTDFSLNLLSYSLSEHKWTHGIALTKFKDKVVSGVTE